MNQGRLDKKRKQNRLFSQGFILICIVYAVYEMAHEMAYAVLPLLLDSLSASGTIIGLMTSLNVIAGMICRPAIGNIADKYSKKLICLIGIGFVVICYLGMAWSAYISSVGMLLLFRTIHGIAAAAASTSCYAIVADVSPKSRRTDAYGYFGVFFSVLGGISPELALVLSKNGDYAGTILVMALIAAASMIPVLFLPFATINEHKSETSEKQCSPQKVIDKYLERTAVPATLIIFLLTASLASAKSFMILYAAEKGLPDIGLYFVLTAAGGIIIRFFIGPIRRKTGDRVLLIIGILMLAINFAIITMMNNYYLLLIGGLLNGFGTGIYNAVLDSAAISKTVPERYGIASSTMLLGIDLGFIVGSALWGIAADIFGYKMLFLLATILLVVSAVASVWAVERNIEGAE